MVLCCVAGASGAGDVRRLVDALLTQTHRALAKKVSCILYKLLYTPAVGSNILSKLIFASCV